MWQVAVSLLIRLTPAVRVSQPNSTFPLAPENVFKCKSVGKGCPRLSVVVGRITATDPETNEQMTFKDVMAGHVGGKGYVKEWDWGHHDPRTHHAGGPGPKEFGELAWDVYGILDGSTLRTVYLSTGVNGALHQKASMCSDVMKNFQPHGRYMEGYHSRAGFARGGAATAANDTEEARRPRNKQSVWPQVGPCWKTLAGVSEDEGEYLKTVKYGDISDCKRTCDETPESCKSFAACPGDGHLCYLHARAFRGNERIRDPPVGRKCRTYYRSSCHFAAVSTTGDAAPKKASRTRRNQGVFRNARCVKGRSQWIVKKWNRDVGAGKDVAVLLHSAR